MSRWRKHLVRNSSILFKSQIIAGLRIGPRFVLPEWTGFKSQMWTWKNGETGIFLPKDEFMVYDKVVMDKARSEPEFAFDYKSSCIKVCDEVVEKSEALSSKVDKQISNQDLLKLFEELMIEWQRLGETIIVNHEDIEKEVASRLENPEDLGALTASSELTPDALEELDRLKMIKFAKDNFVDFFVGKEVEQSFALVEDSKELNKKLKDHVEKYCWIPLNFGKPMWDKSFFIKIIHSYLNDSFDFEARIEQLDSHTEQVIEQKKKLFKTIDEDTRRIVDMLEARTYVRMYRANIFSLTFFKSLPLLKEAARRLYIPVDFLVYYTPDKIRQALLEDIELSALEAQKNKEAFVILIDNNVYKEYQGDKVLKIMQQEYPEQEVKEVSELKGACAYAGKVTGIVKIIFDARDMDKVEVGDILVCNATNPDLVIAMGKAGAIVTEEGGITSHAAIVSREMKKPCIIGTKIATKVLHDGDRVEVDATNGVVRKI